MRVLWALLLLLFCGNSLLSAQSTAGTLRSLAEESFRDCHAMLETARSIDSASMWPHYIQLFPASRRPLYAVFTSETTASQATQWARRDLSRSPAAVLYVIGDRYHFRCRNLAGVTAELSSEDDPLQLQPSAGTAFLHHFYVSDTGVARAFVITSSPLRDLDIAALTQQIKQRLGARSAWVRYRNDPWFVDTTSDSMPFYFTDGFERPSESHAIPRTLLCNSESACKDFVAFF